MGDLASSGVVVASAVNTAFEERLAKIVKQSREFGILREHTAFPTTEATNLSQRNAGPAWAWGQFQNRAIAA
jgi:hypothetical protein